MHVYKSLCKSVLFPFLSPKKLHASENRCLKMLMLCFLQGTSLLRHTLLLHSERVTIHGVVFRIPSWASLSDLVEPFPFGGLRPLADKLLHCLSHTLRSLKLSGIISSGVHFSSYCPTKLSNFLDLASFSHPIQTTLRTSSQSSMHENCSACLILR